MANDGAASPLLTVLAVVRAARKSKLPEVEASNTQNSVIEPQLAVGAGKVTAALLLVVPPVPVEAVVEPADCVPAQFASEEVTETRAYEPPDTSVPHAASEPVEVARAT